MKSKLVMIAMTILGIASPGQAQEQKSGIDKANMDLSVKPGDDFYEYSAGSWLKNHPLDAVHPMNGAFTDLDEQNNDRIKELVAEYAAKKMPHGTDGQKLGALYRMYMDSVKRNKLGYTPIKPVLAKINKVKNRKECIKLMYELGAKGYGTTLFRFGLGINPNNASQYMFSAVQGGLGLDPEYYTSPNEQQKAVAEAYKSLMKDYFKMVGNSENAAEKKMQAVWALENQLAAKSYDQVKQRNPQENTHLLSWQQLLKDFNGIDWKMICDTYQYPSDIDTVNVGQPEPLHEVENILANADLEAIKAYMEVSVVGASAGCLSDDFGNRRFEYLKARYGVKEQQPRWKRAVGLLDGMLGETIGKLYVAKYFPESHKQRAYEMIKNLQAAFAERIKSNTWMTSATKEKALEKLNGMVINVAYPDKWEGLEKYVQVDENKTLSENFERITMASRKGEIEYYWHRPVDRHQMGCTPQTVNAFYNPQSNSINFPAAILQPPFYDPEADDAANYGAIGCVIGHEMSHGFDDEGCAYDKDGNLKNWWTDEDKKNFDERGKVLEDWFGSKEMQPGLKVNGKKTLGENIGDNGGINIAFQALKKSMEKNPLGVKDGFTPEQRFFLAYGRMWASNIAPQFVAYIVNSDVHSPNSLRVNAALPMIDAWYTAFGIKEGDKLFVPADKRAHIW